jgi:ABC-2 type transport system permease protein
MTDLVATELLKIRTLRLSWAVLGLAVVLAGLVAYAAVSVATGTGDGDITAADLDLAFLVRAPAEGVWFLAILVAIVASAGDWQHHTVRATYLAEPRRPRVVAAKLAASAVAGLVVALAATGTSLVAGGVLLHLEGLPVALGDVATWRALGAVVGLTALWAVVASGLGTLAGNTTVAIVVLLMWRFVGEGVLPVLSDVDPRWLPSGAAQAVLQGGAGRPDLLEPPAGAGMLAAYAAVVTVLGVAVLLRREAP